MANSNSIFNTKYVELSTKWSMSLHFHNPTCAYNQRCNLSQEIVSLLPPIFTSLFHPYLLAKLSLQSPLTLPVSIYQRVLTFLFLRTTVPTISTKHVSPTSDISPIQAAPRDQRAWEPCEDWHWFNLCLLPQGMGNDNRAHNHWFFIAQIQKIGVLQLTQTIQSTFSHLLNLLPLLPCPINTTTRTHITQQTSCVTYFHPKFSILIYWSCRSPPILSEIISS